jgi:hypothetical protein
VQVAVGREEVDRLRGDEMALGRHERFADGQRAPRRQRVADAVAAADAPQPVGQQSCDLRPPRAHAREQAVAVARALRAVRHRSKERDTRRRAFRVVAFGDPALGGFQPLQFHRIEALAQHGLEGVLPAGLDVESLPQPAGILEAVVGEPLRAVLALSDLRLQRGQRLRARLDVRELVAGLLRSVAHRALPILQLLHRLAQCIERGLLGGELGRLLAQLLLDVADLRRHRRARRVELAFQPFAARRELRQKLGHVLALGLDHADRLLGQARSSAQAPP